MPEAAYKYWQRTGAKIDARIGALQLVLPPGARQPTPVELARVRWTPKATAAIRALQADAAALKGHPVTIPYSTLVGALQAHVPEALLVTGRMQDTWGEKGETAPVLDFAAVDDETEARRKIGEAVGLWCDRTLADFNGTIGLPGQRLAVLRALVENDQAFEIQPVHVAMPPDAKRSFVPARDVLLAIVARELAGVAPFPDPRIGPLHRVVRSDGNKNSIDFMSWPFDQGGHMVSAVMTVSVETAPWTASPIVRVEVAKRRWCPSVPKPYHFGRQKGVVAYAMLRDRNVAVNVPMALKDRAPADPNVPAYVLEMLSGQQTQMVGRPLGDILAEGNAGRVFLGLPYKTTYDSLLPKEGPQAGAATADNVYAFEAVAKALESYGFVPAGGEMRGTWRLAGAGKLAPLRPEHVALAIRERTDGAAGRPAWPAGLQVPDVEKTHVDELAELRQAQAERLDRAYGAERRIGLRVFSRTAAEQDLVRLGVETLFGDRVAVTTAMLPPNTHGPFRKGDRRRQKVRNDDVLKAWKPACERFAEDAARGGPQDPRLALVVAPRTFSVIVDGKSRLLKDDRVAKPAARTALAEYAGANSQFLVPLGERFGLTQKAMGKFLMRTQAALNDLLLGHAGLMGPLDKAFVKAFPEAETRPTCVLALTLIKKNRSMTGGDKNAVLAAVKVDAKTARCTVRLGWRSYGEPDVSPDWVPYAEALRSVASTTVGSIGAKRDEQKTTANAFLAKVLSGLAERGERALVLIDATGLAGLWPWISDREITGPLKVGDGIVDPAIAYPGFRFVRLRSRGIPRVVTSQQSVFKALTDTGELVDGTEEGVEAPTVEAGIVRMGEGDAPVPHYLMTLSYGDINMRPARGQSALAQANEHVLRSPKRATWPEGMPRDLKNVHELREASNTGLKPYRKPLSLDVTMPIILDGDDPDLIAALIMYLRGASEHTNAKTFLPAPVSFERQIKNYMAKYILDEEDLPEEEEPDDEEGEDDDEQE